MARPVFGLGFGSAVLIALQADINNVLKAFAHVQKRSKFS